MSTSGADESCLENTIKKELRRIGSQTAQGDDSEILIWLLDGDLACSQRPLRYHPTFGGRGKKLPPDAKPLVVEWVDRVKSLGIRSIISLLEDHKHHKYYIEGELNLHPEGLYGYYRSKGFECCVIPIVDSPRSVKSNCGKALVAEVLAACDRMPKPVLLHCSAGIDRTSPVAAHIVSKRSHQVSP